MILKLYRLFLYQPLNPAHPDTFSPKSLHFTQQEGMLMRKPAASERAWFLEEESELRTQADFLAGKIRGLTYQLA
jgi:hypothetical protein